MPCAHHGKQIKSVVRLKYFFLATFFLGVTTYFVFTYLCSRTKVNPIEVSSDHWGTNYEAMNLDLIKSSQRSGSEVRNVLFFNRVPKTGSEMIVLLMQWLQSENGFKHVRFKNSVNRFLAAKEQLDFAVELSSRINRSEFRLISFDKHLHFTDLPKFGVKMPLLINIVRDPVEKMSSRFYYARVTPRPGSFTPPNYQIPKQLPYVTVEECIAAKGEECTFVDGREYDLAIPYFCGHEDFCRQLNNVAAFLKAKRNVEKWYSVVGLLEHLNRTFSVLENVLPQFFRGVTDLYFKELHGFQYNKNIQKPDEVAAWAKKELREDLTLEYEFYDFLKQRLQNQYLELQKENL